LQGVWLIGFMHIYFLLYFDLDGVLLYKEDVTSILILWDALSILLLRIDFTYLLFALFFFSRLIKNGKIVILLNRLRF
jgi:hypothetical protein